MASRRLLFWLLPAASCGTGGGGFPFDAGSPPIAYTLDCFGTTCHSTCLLVDGSPSCAPTCDAGADASDPFHPDAQPLGCPSPSPPSFDCFSSSDCTAVGGHCCFEPNAPKTICTTFACTGYVCTDACAPSCTPVTIEGRTMPFAVCP